MTRTHCPSPAAVATIAAANHVPLTRTSHAAVARVGGVVYWWVAA